MADGQHSLGERDVVVVGGGVVGVASAYFLARRGARVSLLEQGELCAGASYGNAGWIFPSHSTPLPAPGVLRQSLRWLFDRQSPLYIKPRPSLELARWLLAFLRASRGPLARRTFALNRELSLASQELYAKLALELGAEVGYRQLGLMVACRTRRALDAALAELRELRELGGEGRQLGPEELLDFQPALAPGLAGGVYFPADAHLSPADFVHALAAEAVRLGVDVRTQTEVLQIERPGGGRSRVIATRGEFPCDELVLAGGAWSPGLSRPLGLRLPVQPAKGYSVTVRRPEGVGDVPVMLSESKVGVPPLGPLLRFAGTRELAGLDLSIQQHRIAAILRAASVYLPGLVPEGGIENLERVETWRGLRPLTPDDLPAIGRPRALPGVVIATGHGMSGMSQGPITGLLVAQLIAGETPALDLAPFSPDRF